MLSCHTHRFRHFNLQYIYLISYENAKKAGNWLNPSDIVFAINYKGIVRAYPQRILNWHEIVNDHAVVDGEDYYFMITFCPLCGSAVGFERSVDGVITEFGVSGKLHNNDLVMYDRFEGNLWQQITGEAIVGPAARRNEILIQILLLFSEPVLFVFPVPEPLCPTGYCRLFHL